MMSSCVHLTFDSFSFSSAVPLFANVTLQTAKFIGTYVRMMEILPLISVKVLVGISQLVQLYVSDRSLHFVWEAMVVRNGVRLVV
jgi:hypothetical protein